MFDRPIGHLRAASNRQRREVWQLRQWFQSRIVDLGPEQVEVAQSRDAGKLRDARVGHLAAGEPELG
jgi:acetolactate synthase small subunit